jgi:hypothetical protein
MPEHGELRVGEFVDGRDASMKFEHPVASVALEMVMVSLARQLIQHCAAGQVNGS